ncbi:hypothetical protein HJC99_05600 [Candidatus Saccharibacteria bacterium]|nr:hypothetical protein [Candidatus Saccharibacteria bacterium]
MHAYKVTKTKAFIIFASAVLCLAVTVWLFYSVWFITSRQAQLRANGIDAVATLDSQASRSKRSWPVGYVNYHFSTTSGQVVTSKFVPLDINSFSNLPSIAAATEIAVRYLPSNPQINAPTTDSVPTRT